MHAGVVINIYIYINLKKIKWLKVSEATDPHLL